MPFALKGRTMAITGAANIPMSPIVRVALENGMNVALLSAFHSRAQKAIEETVPDKFRGQIIGFAQNPQARLEQNMKEAPELYTPETTQADVLRWICEKFGGIDVVVNGSGSAERCDMYATDKDLWHHSAETPEASFFNSMYAMEYLEKSPAPRIINIISDDGFGGFFNNPSFAASRGGVVSLTREMARELGPKGITVNTVVHSYIEKKNAPPLTEQERTALISATPLGRLCTFEDLAGIVCFLATDEASYITGACINVTGGSVLE